MVRSHEMDEQLTTMNIEERRVNVEPMEELQDVFLEEEHLDRITRIGTQASLSFQKRLILFLKKNWTSLLGAMRICR